PAPQDVQDQGQGIGHASVLNDASSTHPVSGQKVSSRFSASNRGRHSVQPSTPHAPYAATVVSCMSALLTLAGPATLTVDRGTVCHAVTLRHLVVQVVTHIHIGTVRVPVGTAVPVAHRQAVPPGLVFLNRRRSRVGGAGEGQPSRQQRHGQRRTGGEPCPVH